MKTLFLAGLAVLACSDVDPRGLLESSGAPHGDGPTAADPNCGGYVNGLPRPSSEWILAQVASGECAEVSAVPVGRDFYSACEYSLSIPSECSIEVGTQHCRIGHWTMFCRANSDCPEGAVCQYSGGVGDVPESYSLGSCVLACTGSGTGPCGRCDLECNSVYCAPPSPWDDMP